MKTIIIVITQGIVARNLLRTDIFKILKSMKDLKIVLAILHSTPFYKNKNFAAEFSKRNVIVENIDVRANIVERALRAAGDLVFFNANYVETRKIKELELKKKNYPAYLKLKFLKKILGKNKNLIKAFEDFDRSLFSYKHKYYKKLFEKYKPDLVFSTDFVHPNEWGLVKAAKHYKVPVITLIPSWDHLTYKGRLPTKFDKVIVWNDILKEQLIKLYGYESKDIFVSGIPQFDYYVSDRDKLRPREVFLKEIGAKPNEKLITYTSSSPTIAPCDPDVIEIICEAIKTGKIKYPAHLRVRFYHADDFSRYERLKKYGDILTFEKPGKSSSRLRYVWAPDWEDMLHYANLLLHSDVVINVASTVTLDAVAFDTPVINVGFDGYEKKPYWGSVVRSQDYTHYVPVVKSGGVKIAKNGEELIKYINNYLGNPKLDSEGRKRIVKEQCYRLDGKSGERIAKFILNLLSKK